MSRLQFSSSSLRIALLALGAVAVTLVLLGGGYLLLTSGTPDPWAAYRPALNQRASVDPAQMASMAQYSITVQIDPVAVAYTGTLDIQFPVTGTTPLNEIYFRLLPNLPQFKGQMQITSAIVNGMPVNYGFAADGSAVHLVLTKPLVVNQPARVQLGFTGDPPERKEGLYTLVGKNGDVFSLGTFYPVLAARRQDGWALDISDPQGDAAYHEAALYEVDVTAPADQVIAASGTVTSRKPAAQPGAEPAPKPGANPAAESAANPAADGWTTTHYVLGPAREFSLIMSPSFRILEDEAYGTRVRSYYLPGDEEAGKSAFYTALSAMEIFSDQFGPYPYRDMAVVEAPLTFRGQEFPGMSLIGSQVYSKYQSDLEKLVAHEVAHQWWYNQVGSDQIRSPWLDEGLAEWSMYAYFQSRHGDLDAELLRIRRWEGPVAVARQDGTDRPIGNPVVSYNARNYETVVYAKGALFFATLRDAIGADAFRTLLRRYLAQERWRVSTPDVLSSLAQQVSGKDLKSLFAQWVDGKSK